MKNNMRKEMTKEVSFADNLLHLFEGGGGNPMGPSSICTPTPKPEPLPAPRDPGWIDPVPKL